MTRTKTKRKQKISGWKEKTILSGSEFPEEFPLHLVSRMPPHVQDCCFSRWERIGDFPIDGVPASVVFTRQLIRQGESPRKVIPSSLLSPLHVATRSDSKKEKDSLLYAHNIKNSFPFHQIAFFSRTAGSTSGLVRELLKHKVDPSSRDSEGNTPIHYAAFPSKIGDESSDSGPLFVLLNHFGVDPDIVNREGNSPLHLASNYDIVRILLSKGAHPSKQNSDGNTLLHLLFRCPKWPIPQLDRIVGLLIEYNVDVNVRNNQKETFLHVLLQRGPQFVDSCVIIVRKMLEKGIIDFSIRDEKGRSYYDIVLHRFRTGFDTYRMLMLFWRLEEERQEQQNIECWGLVNAGGATPLHFLASSLHAPTIEGHIEEMRRVVKAGVSPEELDKEEVTPLHLVLQLANEDNVLGLCPYFPELPFYTLWVEEDEEENRKELILKQKRIFVTKFITEVVQFLVCEAKADPNQATPLFQSPLHLAVASPFYTPSLIDHLLSSGADGSLTNENGHDLLVDLFFHQFPSLELVKEILKKGVNAKSSLGEKNGALAILADNYRNKWDKKRVEWKEYFRVILEEGGNPNSVLVKKKERRGGRRAMEEGGGGTVLQLLLESLLTWENWVEVMGLVELLVEWGVNLDYNSYSLEEKERERRGGGGKEIGEGCYNFSAAALTYVEVVLRAMARFRPCYRQGVMIQSIGREFGGLLELLLRGGLRDEEARKCKEIMVHFRYNPRVFLEADREDMKEWMDKGKELLERAVVCSILIKGARRRR